MPRFIATLLDARSFLVVLLVAIMAGSGCAEDTVTPGGDTTSTHDTDMAAGVDASTDMAEELSEGLDAAQDVVPGGADGGADETQFSDDVAMDTFADQVTPPGDVETSTPDVVALPEVAMDGLQGEVTPTPDASSDAPSGDLVDAAEVCVATNPDAQGPFYVPGAPLTTDLTAPDVPGMHLFLDGLVVGTDCAPLPGAVTLEVWQTDADGEYPSLEEDGYELRGTIPVAADGSYAFTTIYPGLYEGRPRHLHFKVAAEGYVSLVTQLYFEGDPFLYPVDSCKPPTCDSGDPDRIISLEEFAGDTGAVFIGSFTFVLAPE